MPEKREYEISWPNVIRIDHVYRPDPQPTLLAMVATLIHAGPRREAVLWLTPEDVDLERRSLHIRTKRIAGEFWQPKTKGNAVGAYGNHVLTALARQDQCGGSSALAVDRPAI